MNIAQLDIFNSVWGVVGAALALLVVLFLLISWIALPIFLYVELRRMGKSIRDVANMMVNINIHVANTESNARKLANFFDGRNIEVNRNSNNLDVEVAEEA